MWIWSRNAAGIGRRLYEELENILKQQGILNVNACIAYPQVKDEYLTKDSVLFHEKLGYTMVGIFHQCGYKFHRWYDMVWMEKFIGEHREKSAGYHSVSGIEVGKVVRGGLLLTRNLFYR